MYFIIETKPVGFATKLFTITTVTRYPINPRHAMPIASFVTTSEPSYTFEPSAVWNFDKSFLKLL